MLGVIVSIINTASIITLALTTSINNNNNNNNIYIYIYIYILLNTIVYYIRLYVNINTIVHAPYNTRYLVRRIGTLQGIPAEKARPLTPRETSTGQNVNFAIGHLTSGH